MKNPVMSLLFLTPSSGLFLTQSKNPGAQLMPKASVSSDVLSSRSAGSLAPATRPLAIPEHPGVLQLDPGSSWSLCLGNIFPGRQVCVSSTAHTSPRSWTSRRLQTFTCQVRPSLESNPAVPPLASLPQFCTFFFHFKVGFRPSLPMLESVPNH